MNKPAIDSDGFKESVKKLEHNYAYHPPQDAETVIDHENIRAETAIVARFFNRELPDSREKALALTKLEEAMFWANAAIARN